MFLINNNNNIQGKAKENVSRRSALVTSIVTGMIHDQSHMQYVHKQHISFKMIPNNLNLCLNNQKWHEIGMRTHRHL